MPVVKAIYDESIDNTSLENIGLVSDADLTKELRRMAVPYYHNQITASDTWVINHGKISPTIEITDNAGNAYGVTTRRHFSFDNADANYSVIFFTNPSTGKAIAR